jgi:hypothetical protein
MANVGLNIAQKLTLLTSLLLFHSSALALEFSLVGGLNLAAPGLSENSNVRNTTGTPAVAYGGLINVPLIFLKLDLESGLLVQQGQYSFEVLGVTQQRRFRELQIPLLLRYRIDPLVGIGFGAYYGMSQSGFNSLYKKNELGLLFNIHALLPIIPHWFLCLDGRYQMGTQDRSQDLNVLSYRTRSVQGLVGITYFFRPGSDEAKPQNPIDSSLE